MKFKNMVCGKLKKFAQCFSDLDSYIQMASVSQETEDMKFEIFDKCTSNVCGRCNRQGTCWEGNYKTTYENLYGLVSQWVDKGNVDFKKFAQLLYCILCKVQGVVVVGKKFNR